MLRLNLDKLSINRDEFVNALREKGIGTSVHFIPISFHPYFSQYLSEGRNVCPNALDLYPRLISLPLYPAMTEDDVKDAARAVRQVAQRGTKSKMVFAGMGDD